MAQYGPPGGMPPPMRARSPRGSMENSGGFRQISVAQTRSHRLEPIPMQPRTPRRPDASPGRTTGGYNASPARLPPTPRKEPPQPAQKKAAARPAVPPAVLLGLSQAAAAVRELNWNKFYSALDVVIRYLIPCESFTLYLVEDRGRYLKKINTHLEAFPPHRRGSQVDVVSEATIEGCASITVEPSFLPSQSRWSQDWSTREASIVHPRPGMPTMQDVAMGGMISPGAWSSGDEGAADPTRGPPTIDKVHNSMAWPMRFGIPEQDFDDPFADYSSADSQQIGADETVFGVIKLTNRLADRARGRKLRLRRLGASGSSRRGPGSGLRYKMFSEADCRLMAAITGLIKEIYFAVDPLTFGPPAEPSLELGDSEPLNAPSLQGRSVMSGKSLPSGSRMVDAGQQARSGGLFGVLGSAFAKSTAQRRRAPELPDLVPKPDVTVTSDSNESMRNAPGWIHKEWTEEDASNLAAERKLPGQRRIGGITLLATWRLRQEAIVDPFCVICRFQLRLRRTSNALPGRDIWRAMPPFFCVSPDEITQQYCAFLTEYLQYGEEYVVSVRAGSADRWSEWSVPSDPIVFEADPLRPRDNRVELDCEVIGPNCEVSGLQRPADPYSTHDHHLKFTWPAFVSFDPRTPLPVEYLIEAWQRLDDLGAASPWQVKHACREAQRQKRVVKGIHELLPGAGADWVGSRQVIVTTTLSSSIAGERVATTVSLRDTALVPNSEVYFAVRARYMSLPSAADWCEEALFTNTAFKLPDVTPTLPAPVPVLAEEYNSAEGVEAGASDTLVVQWPFIHPATFCPPDDRSAWMRGSFCPDAGVADFPLPFRLQYRTVGEGKPGYFEDREVPPMVWSAWQESHSYTFVMRRVAGKLPAQKGVAADASSGEFLPESLNRRVDEAAEGCLDPYNDPLQLLNEDWALHVKGLKPPPAGTNGWSGLVQVRWISCRVEGVVSAASAVLCTSVAALPAAPVAQHLTVNCSSGSRTGQEVLKLADGPSGVEEDVVHELRHVARLTWSMDMRAASFAFLKGFRVRYKELPPQASGGLQGMPWRELPPAAITDALDVTGLSGGGAGAMAMSSLASFRVDLAEVPLLRFHFYTFSIQVRSAEHVSEWSMESESLCVQLPDILPAELSAEADLQVVAAGPVSSKRKGQKDGEDASEDTSSPDESALRPLWADDGKQAMNALLEALLCFPAAWDATTWRLKLRWIPFAYADDGLAKFPPLKPLPIEYKISYYVLTERPSAKDSVSEETSGEQGSEALELLERMENAVHFLGRVVPDDHTSELHRQQQEAVVCGEGWIAASEGVAIRDIPRHRLPPLRCDVRMFVVCRCPVVSGPQWARTALAVDVALPRQVPLPLPVPRQLSCVELQSRGLAADFGAPMADGSLPRFTPTDGLLAVLAIPAFMSEFVLVGSAEINPEMAHGPDASENDLLALEIGNGEQQKHHDRAHYVLQYRRHALGERQQCGAGLRPPKEEPGWHTVRSVRRLIDASEESVYVASGFDALDASELGGGPDETCWVTFRLASRERSHYSYGSAAACLSMLPAPARPTPAVAWRDSPSLSGVSVSLTAKCNHLSQAYQLRYRLAEADPTKEASWSVCEVQELQPGSLGIKDSGSDDLLVTALAPVEKLTYHLAYCFGVRTVSPLRFSAWSEDSEPVRLSLEHQGRAAELEEEEAAAARNLEVNLLGLEERHNYRCPTANFTWPPLKFKPGRFDTRPSNELTVEYRVRFRRHIDEHNDRVALGCAVDELGELDNGPEREARRGAHEGASVIYPDPDAGVKDSAGRGYEGDCTKRPHPLHEASPWQTLAVVPAQAGGATGTERVGCAMTFLQPGCDYEVAVDWRWRRLGDAFWMPAYDALRFTTRQPTPAPPPPVQVPLPPEAWDDMELRNFLGTGSFLLLQWPFAQPPSCKLAPSALGTPLKLEAFHEPLEHGSYAIQCRPQDRLYSGWLTCKAHHIRYHEKPLCLIKKMPKVGKATEDSPTGDKFCPKPVGTNELEPHAIEDDELEFRVVRVGDCEVSAGLPLPVAPPPPPEKVSCVLKLLGPHSTFVACVRFRAAVTTGRGTVPRAYQVLVEEQGGDMSRLLRPVQLPLERLPEAFPGLRSNALYMGSKEEPAELTDLGELAQGARGGGESLQQLHERQFEHLLTSEELNYGSRYKISLRWLSPWRVSDWCEEPVEVLVQVPCPVPTESIQDLKLKVLEPLELPQGVAASEGAGCFAPPAVAEQVELSWAPFRASLWGGGRMEYEVQKQCLLWDRRPPGDDAWMPPDGETAGSGDIDATEWDSVGIVLTEVEDATGLGVNESSFFSSFYSADTWPTSASSEHEVSASGSEKEPRAEKTTQEEIEDQEGGIREVLTEVGDAIGLGMREAAGTEVGEDDEERPATSDFAREVSPAEDEEDFADGSAEGEDSASGAERKDARRITFVARELQPRAWYRFRLRARLKFHPNSGFEEEWSEFIGSVWHRTMDADPEPTAPMEASAAAEPTPPELLEDGSVLVDFGLLPIREAERPDGCPAPPSPYELQYRGAEEPDSSDWHPVQSRPFGEAFLVAHPPLKRHAEYGVVFRLWRCPGALAPGVGPEGPHRVEDDLRVRGWPGLSSQPSLPLRVVPPDFEDNPIVQLVLGEVDPLRPSTPKEAAGSETSGSGVSSKSSASEAEATTTAAGTETTAEVSPQLPKFSPRPLVVRLIWRVKVPENSGLEAVSVAQVRFRRLTLVAVLPTELLPRVKEEECDDAGDDGAQDGEALAQDWNAFQPFEWLIGRLENETVHDLPIALPDFVLGADYEASVRVGTMKRWSRWSDPINFSLSIRPPLPPEEAKVEVETVTLEDGTNFFKLSWPAFEPHPLCIETEYRIRMIRATRYSYKIRLNPQMIARSLEAFEAQKELHVVGCVRRAVPRPPGPIDFDWRAPKETIVFMHRVAADPECGFTFVVDAKHERCKETDGQDLRDGVAWSASIESEEVLTPPLYKHWFVPSQVPLESSPMQSSTEFDKVRAPYPLSISELTCDKWGLSDPRNDVLLMFAPWITSKESSKWPHRIEYSPYVPLANSARCPIPNDGSEHDVEWYLPRDVKYVTEEGGEPDEGTVQFHHSEGPEVFEEYERRLLSKGAEAFTDSDSRFRNIPAELNGISYWAGPQAELPVGNIKLSCSQPGVVYIWSVGHAAECVSQLDEWEQVLQCKLRVGRSELEVYKKDLPQTGELFLTLTAPWEGGFAYKEEKLAQDLARRRKADMVLLRGFDLSLWDRENMKRGMTKDRAEILGNFVRVRVVREGGPEGLQAFSVPSVPMRLTMPGLPCRPSVTVWAQSGEFQALIWWPCLIAAVGEDDKNIGMQHQMHQIRMRRPLYDEDGGWVLGPPKTTPIPVNLHCLEDGLGLGARELHAFDLTNLLDVSTMPAPMTRTILPDRPTGTMPEPGVLTYQFCVRCSDGYRWSDWSAPSDLVSLALEPILIADAPVDIQKFQEVMEENAEDVICPATPLLDAHFHNDLIKHIQFTEEGDLIPPHWVSVARFEEKAADARHMTQAMMTSPIISSVEMDAKRSLVQVRWPVLPPQAYSKPEDAMMDTIEEILLTGLIPPYMPSPVVYRINVWLVSSAADAAPMTDLPEGLPRRDSHMYEEDEDLEPLSGHHVLYRQYDVPPFEFPEPDNDEGISDAKMGHFTLPYLLPDRVFYVTVEGRFQTLPAVEWWTPLMVSGTFTMPRLPPPAPPISLPICELPTPEYKKLLERAALGSSAIVAVRWPWPVTQSVAEALRSAPYALEFCSSSIRPGYKDPTAEAGIRSDSVDVRPTGPWKEALALQLCLVNFERHQVLEEIPMDIECEGNWIPILVASGLHPSGHPWSADKADEHVLRPEASFVYVRWRYRARPHDFASIPTPLHFSPASLPLRTKVVTPAISPRWCMDCQHRRIVAWVHWEAWFGAAQHQLSYRIIGKVKDRKTRKSRKKKTAEGTSGTTSGQISPSESESSLSGTEASSVVTTQSQAAARPGALNVSQMKPLTGWIELPLTRDGVDCKTIDPDMPELLGHGSAEAFFEATPEDQLLAEYTLPFPAKEWNGMLFRRYRDQPEFFVTGMKRGIETSTYASSAPTESRKSLATSRATSPGLDGSDSSPGDAPRRASASSRPDDSRSMRSGATSHYGSAANSFKLQYGMLIEWRIRVSDGLLWSNWSPTSAAVGIVPPLPRFTMALQVDYSGREPTIARIAWGGCELPEQFDHLTEAIEYVVYVTTSDQPTSTVIKTDLGALAVERLQRRGFCLSEGTSGVVQDYDGEVYTGGPKLNIDELFAKSTERRLLGKFTQAHSKLINFRTGPGQDAVMETITGFELTVSGLKPESLHRFSVRARCATGGLEEVDWQNLKVDSNHPLRWSDAVNTQAILTPKMPPPLLVPEPIMIPDGKFARFRHTPCLLLKCALFKKHHSDDFDKVHPVVIDCKEAGAPDEKFQVVPLENSIYADIEPHGPCRLLYNLPSLHVELRARNTVMNDISTSCPPAFAVPPLPLETKRGPAIDLVVTEKGDLFVQLTWATRCLELQEPQLVQISLKRHSVEAPPVDLQAFEVPGSMRIEEVPPNALMAAREEYQRLAEEADLKVPPPPVLGQRQCPFACRRCLLPLDTSEVPKPEALGEHGKARLDDLYTALAEGTMRRDSIPTYTDVEDEFRSLRPPHQAEIQAKEEERNRLEGKQLPAKQQKSLPVCRCRDLVLQRALPVDGKQICYGTTYRFRVRVKDALTWSPWTDFSREVHVIVPPPRVPLPLRDPQNPAPPPLLELCLLRNNGKGDDMLSDFGSSAAPGDVRLGLRWPRFEGQMREVEYRVFMWTLSPELRRKAADRGGGGSKPLDASKGRGCALPPIVGVQSIVAEYQPAMPGMPAFGTPGEAPREPDPHPLAVVRPRALAPDGKTSLGKGSDAAVQHSSDAPQVIAHVRPFEPPPRANALRRGARKAAAADALAGEPQPASPREGGKPPLSVLSVEVHSAVLPKGYGYVFAVEAKYGRGACGNASDWSAPLFSKLLEFESASKQLSLEVEGRFGSLVFKGTAVTSAQPTNEQLVLEASSVSFVDEHRDLPKAMPLLPEGDPWPLNTSNKPGKYLVRSLGKVSTLDDVSPTVMQEKPAAERRAAGDDLREPDDARELLKIQEARRDPL
eukprot:TRINITY_DN19004_c0_g1_i1.p1 TRINITY_DN19004_c0_g1~~TRINITY_DN19004_c0_g1_i1.p1  ORF type:complete len:5161 (+),score=1174.84 TRINITY_DN19004_c0_g1_i1:79-15483(+)